MKKLISTLLVSLALFMCIFSTTNMSVYADESKVLTLGANLTEEQKQLVIDYLGVDISQVVVIEVNNDDEHALLDGIATQQQIGTRTFSCSYIEPTNFGGIHIKTVNLSWVTSDMIRNALVTSGITNCNVICMSPIEVSGTGALTGIFKAYDNISDAEITEEAKELASEELVTTSRLAESIGQNEASLMISEIKARILTDEIDSEEEIESIIREYISEHDIQISDDDIWKIVDLLLKISQQDYDIEEIKEAYKDIKQTAEELKEAADNKAGVLEKISNALSKFWNWLTGKAQEMEESGQLEEIKNTLGILADTNDSLLGNNTVVTNTDEQAMQEIESEVEQNTDAKDPWYQWILDIFNSGNKKDSKEDSTIENNLTFDDFQSDAEEYQEEINSIEDESESESQNTEENDSGMIQYIRDTYEDVTSENSNLDDSSIGNTKSFNELLK